MRRRDDGGVVVAVRVRGRSTAAVLADLVEGVLVANRTKFEGTETESLRGQLLAAVEASEATARAA